jgi:seryl-tRNA synthetase
MAAILEHYQMGDKIIIPEALHKFTGFTEIKF